MSFSFLFFRIVNLNCFVHVVTHNITYTLDLFLSAGILRTSRLIFFAWHIGFSLNKQKKLTTWLELIIG